ncbi:MAG: S53 family peptidase [Thermoplasmata archaeon]
MASLLRSIIRLFAVVSIVGVLVLSSAPSHATALAGDGPSAISTSGLVAYGIPSALQAPFAARAGFDPSEVAGVANVQPLRGNVSVGVTFLPRSPSFFSPPIAGASVLTNAELQAAYGLTDAQYLAAEQYFESFGLTIQHTFPDQLHLTVAGSATRVAAAFSTHLFSGQLASRLVQFPGSAPSLPTTLEGEVGAITGLSNGFSIFTLPLRTVGAAPSRLGGSSATPAATGSFIYPNTPHMIYGFDGLYNYSGSPHFATHEGIVLLLWGDGYAPSDLATFYSTYYPSDFPTVPINAYPVDGAPEPSSSAVTDPSGAPEELTLDLEWSGSQAPGATLNAVYAPDGPESNSYSPTDASMEDALTTAIQDVPNVEVLSMSFGLVDGGDAALQAAFETDFAEAGQKGITVLAASGDNGGTSDKGCAGSAAPEYPAASPYVVAVGGTAPTLSYNFVGQPTGLASEPAWNLSGGGFSSDYAAPSWQLVGSAAGPITAGGGRGIPDVAAAASDDFLYYNGQALSGYGTSFATPLWAGLVAEMDAIRGTPFGFITPRLYTIGAAEAAGTAAQGIIDVTSGANCLYSATTGWDPVTGWGTPRGVLLYEDLTGTYVDLELAAGGSVSPGSTIALTVTVVNASDQAPISGVPVALGLSGDTGGPCGGIFDTSTVMTGTNGQALVYLAVPWCYVGLHAIATATLSASGYFGLNSTRVLVDLVGIPPAPYSYLLFALIMGLAILAGVALNELGARRHDRDETPPSMPPGANATLTTPASPIFSPPAEPVPPPPPPPPPEGSATTPPN